jgi:hypothetical protein
MTAHSAVADGKLNNEELGSFTRPCDEIKRRLKEGTITLPFVMNGLQSIIEGSPVPTTQDVIDLDADPFVPNCWNVEEHHKGGQFQWDPAKVMLYLFKKRSKLFKKRSKAAGSRAPSSARS